MLDKTGKTMVDFNVHDVQIAVKSGDTYDYIPLGYAAKIALQKQLASKDIYGDGKKIGKLFNDNGYPITLTLTAKDLELEKALGFKEELAVGTADIEQLKSIKVDLFFETDYQGIDGFKKVKKIWLYQVELAPADEEYSQNEDEISTSTVAYTGMVYGTEEQDSTGTSDYVDANGNIPLIFKLSLSSDEQGFDTFHETVAVPTHKAA